MTTSPSISPAVTLVVVPRERFSAAKQSLDSIYAHTTTPFQLIYIDGNSPPPIQNYLQQQAQARDFQLIRTNYYLSPNHARNMGWQHVQTPYLVFIDNDVMVSPGWLQALVHCAESTGAAIVGPLVCEHEPVHQTVHCAGGENHIWQDESGSRHMQEKIYRQGKKVEKVQAELATQPTELVEFHCMFLRTDLKDKVGYLDEALLNTKEHLDFCMSVMQIGESVYFEPSSIVTYVPGPTLEWSDVAFYMLRWSDQWQKASLQRLQQKWDLAEDQYFTAKYKRLGWRRFMTIWDPLNRRLTGGRYSRLLKHKLFNRLDRVLTQWLFQRHQPPSLPGSRTVTASDSSLMGSRR